MQRTQTPRDDQIARAHAIYTPFMLSIYDVLVHGLSNRFAWRCPTKQLSELYRTNLSANHLEAGVGTGFFIDRAGGAGFDRLALLDINRHCLDRAAQRLARFNPTLHQVDLLAFVLLQVPDGVGNHGLDERYRPGKLRRTAKRSLGTILARHIRHLIVVGGDDDAVDVTAPGGLAERVRDQRHRTQLLDVEVGHLVVSPSRGDDGDDPSRPFHDLRASPR